MPTHIKRPDMIKTRSPFTATDAASSLWQHIPPCRGDAAAAAREAEPTMLLPRDAQRSVPPVAGGGAVVDHIDDLRQVLGLVEEAGVSLKDVKCHLFTQEVE